MTKRERSFFLSYPRSGSHWAKARMRAVLVRHYGDPHRLNEINLHFMFTHFGHAANEAINFPGFKYNFPRGSQVVVLLRDAREILASHYHHINKNLQSLNVPPTAGPNEFATGPRGVQRYCCYLNDCEIVRQLAAIHHWNVIFIHYEDFWMVSSVREIPVLLQLGNRLTAKQAEQILDETKGLVGPVPHKEDKHKLTDKSTQEAKWRKTISEETAVRVQEFLKEHCALKQYTDRY